MNSDCMHSIASTHGPAEQGDSTESGRDSRAGRSPAELKTGLGWLSLSFLPHLTSSLLTLNKYKASTMCAQCTTKANGAAQPQPPATEQLLAAILTELQSMKATQSSFEQKVSLVKIARVLRHTNL